MDVRRATELLHAHQDALLTHFAAAAELLADDGAERISSLARARWEALRLVRAYQLFKHGELFDPMIVRGNPGQRRLAQRMKDRCIHSMQIFVDHVARWSMADVAADWDSYRTATRGIIDALRMGIVAERRDADELLAGVTRTRSSARIAA